jgi:hypothetical protein
MATRAKMSSRGRKGRQKETSSKRAETRIPEGVGSDVDSGSTALRGDDSRQKRKRRKSTQDGLLDEQEGGAYIHARYRR